MLRQPAIRCMHAGKYYCKMVTLHTADFALKQYKRLACYYHKFVEHSSGNRVLQKNDKVQVLKSEEDGKRFIDFVGKEGIYQQMTLF